jgi:hypothetical protein
MPTQLEINHQKSQSKFKEIKALYEVVFGSPDGLKVLEDISISGGVNREIFSTDHSVMSHSEGMRKMALHILFMATPAPDRNPTEART